MAPFHLQVGYNNYTQFCTEEKIEDKTKYPLVYFETIVETHPKDLVRDQKWKSKVKEKFGSSFETDWLNQNVLDDTDGIRNIIK